MQIQPDGSGPVDMQADQPSFTLSQSGTFVKEDFVINRQGIAAVGGAEVEVKTEPSKSSGSVECTYANDTLFASLLVKADSLKYKSATMSTSMGYDGIQV